MFIIFKQRICDKLGNERKKIVFQKRFGSIPAPRKESLIYFALPGQTHFSNGDMLRKEVEGRNGEDLDVERIENGEKWSLPWKKTWNHKAD